MLDCLIIVIFVYFKLILANVHPITIHGHYFVNSVTKEPVCTFFALISKLITNNVKFYIKGIDYQPGGSSAVSKEKDPLSDPVICARDIILFQELGINTIRIYSVNSDLNHDKCMTMLAMAGIYLVLDVNSPLPNHHLNRYEPWTSYNLYYFENIFKIVQQFSFYNNTLGFLAGNEVINDPISASVAAPYIKAVIRDIKNYINYNSPRQIPVGYSAADDLNYRISLAQYLECADNNLMESVDFYGVNSYQWCGDQTFYSSGYNILVNDYKGYTKPLFFSEYGCNEVLPRNFDEVPILYTNNMVDVFSGGLVYEFTQEPNNYGLVEILPNGDVKLLRDFVQLKTKFDTLPDLDYEFIVNSMKSNAKDIKHMIKQYKSPIPKCKSSYPNLIISAAVPPPVADVMIESGFDIDNGKFVELTKDELKTNFRFYQPNGEILNTLYEVDVVVDFEIASSDKKGMYDSRELNEEKHTAGKLYNDTSPTESNENLKEPPRKHNSFVETINKATDSVKKFWANLFHQN
ncbi:gel2 [Candida pseudojiufengensis]|uniref:gel2 n=1 Tax=Candida pseudojiufengensis TaxID=497109 RepID=UPI0022252FC2|nr:gel2 [Candida pseudojiufengensis]KAI5965660.1 gel2 [Candida pseudojiufengensis]